MTETKAVEEESCEKLFGRKVIILLRIFNGSIIDDEIFRKKMVFMICLIMVSWIVSQYLHF